METWRPEEIGATAGKVWNFLHKRGESSLSAVERGVGAPKQLVCMAIGWLAREGKLALRQEKRWRAKFPNAVTERQSVDRA
jgi:hypothetical protein